MRSAAPCSSAVALIVAGLWFATPVSAANVYKRFYVPQIPTASLKADSSIVLHVGEPTLYSGKDRQEDVYEMLENGYVLIGHSSFVWRPADAAGAKAMARSLRAAIVLLYSGDAKTVTETVPVIDWSFIGDALNPKTETTQTSGTVHGTGGSATYSETSTKTVPRANSGPKTVTQTSAVYDQLATYWVKAKPPRCGVLVNDLTPAQRAARGSNKGVVVVAVVKGSPAWAADVLRGDILLRIGDTEVAQGEDFVSAVDLYAGKEVDFLVARGTEEKTLRVRIKDR